MAYVQSIIKNLPEKTGRAIEQWLKLINQKGPDGEKERRQWLKQEFKLGGTTASLIAERSVGKISDISDPEVYLKAAADYVESMYSGTKAGLRPIHDKLIELGASLGKDVKISPCKTIIPLYRKHVFAEIKPATRSRIDFGLALKNCQKTFSKRLIDTGGMAKGDRITHRFEINSLDDIDDEVRAWLRIAYELDS